jgi:hypothetical protein
MHRRGLWPGGEFDIWVVVFDELEKRLQVANVFDMGVDCVLYLFRPTVKHCGVGLLEVLYIEWHIKSLRWGNTQR